jgi:transcriptional regulator with XRE-family HTH domain
VSREAAGAAIRALRESRDWSQADLAAATGVSVMGLSFLERGVRKPHKGTVQKVENGLGLPPGTYARLVVAHSPDIELAQLLAGQPLPETRHDPSTVVVERHTDTAVFEGYAEAQLEALDSVIARLPAPDSNEYQNVVLSVIQQAVKAELLAANSWRVAVTAGADPTGPLLGHVKALESARQGLLARLPDSLAAQFERACSDVHLPEPAIAALLGISTEEMWDIRTRGAVPAGALARVRAFVQAVAG